MNTTTKPSHTPTPLIAEICQQYGEEFNTVLLRGHGAKADALNEDNQTFARLTHCENAEANAARLVECWNTHDTLLKQRDALLEAMNEIADSYLTPNPIKIKALSAIALCEKEKI